MKKQRIMAVFALILNILIVAATAAGLYFTIQANGLTVLKMFTVDSNLLLCLSSLIMIILNIRKLAKPEKPYPAFFRNLKFASVIATTITLVTVLAYLAPQSGDYPALVIGGTDVATMLTSSFFYLHTVAPVLGIISVIFDKDTKARFVSSIYGFIPLAVYTVPYFVFAFVPGLKNQFGGDWYGFLTYELLSDPLWNSLLLSAIVVVIMFLGAFLIGTLLWALSLISATDRDPNRVTYEYTGEPQEENKEQPAEEAKPEETKPTEEAEEKPAEEEKPAQEAVIEETATESQPVEEPTKEEKVNEQPVEEPVKETPVEEQPAEEEKPEEPTEEAKPEEPAAEEKPAEEPKKTYAFQNAKKKTKPVPPTRKAPAKKEEPVEKKEEPAKEEAKKAPAKKATTAKKAEPKKETVKPAEKKTTNTKSTAKGGTKVAAAKKEAPKKAAPAKEPAKKAEPKKAAAPAKKPAKKEEPAKFNGKARVYHISQHENGYKVKLAGGEKAIKTFKTQKEAIAYAKELVNTQGGTYLIHSLDGSIRKG